MNNGRLLIAAVFHFAHPVEKDSSKHHKLTQNFVNFSCQSKWLNFRVRGQFEIKILIVRGLSDINTTYFI